MILIEHRAFRSKYAWRGRRGDGESFSHRDSFACEPAKYKVTRRQSERTEPDLERPHATWYMVLAMADEIAKQALLNRVKEQGEAVRRLKAAQADKTQVRTHPSFFPPSLPRKNLDAFRHRDRCHSPFSFSSCSASLCSIANSVIVSPSLSFAKYARNRFSSKSVSLFLSCVFLHSLSFHVVDSYFSFTFLHSILSLLILLHSLNFVFFFHINSICIANNHFLHYFGIKKWEKCKQISIYDNRHDNRHDVAQ